MGMRGNPSVVANNNTSTGRISNARNGSAYDGSKNCFLHCISITKNGDTEYGSSNENPHIPLLQIGTDRKHDFAGVQRNRLI